MPAVIGCRGEAADNTAGGGLGGTTLPCHQRSSRAGLHLRAHPNLPDTTRPFEPGFAKTLPVDGRVDLRHRRGGIQRKPDSLGFVPGYPEVEPRRSRRNAD
jgi:hypothetical protein